MKVEIKTVIGENCLTQEDGQSVYTRIHPELRNKQNVELDFTGVKVFASTFFNTAIGQLLKDIDAEELNRHLRIVGLSSLGIDTLRNVMRNSREYYAAARKRERDATQKAVESKGQ